MSLYRPSQVTNYLATIKVSCHRVLSAEMGIPLSQEVTLRDRNNSVHATSSTLQFLNQRRPVTGNPVVELMNCSSISSCMSPTLALQPSKVMENYCATARLKPSNRCTKVSHPFSSRSLRALSNINRAWLSFGLICTTGAMEPSTWYAKGLDHNHIGVELPELTEVNGKQGIGINAIVRRWWSLSLP